MGTEDLFCKAVNGATPLEDFLCRVVEAIGSYGVSAPSRSRLGSGRVNVGMNDMRPGRGAVVGGG
jgi:hypothetical protein